MTKYNSDDYNDDGTKYNTNDDDDDGTKYNANMIFVIYARV